MSMTICDSMPVDKTRTKTFRDVMKIELLLLFQLEEAIE